MYRFIKEMNAKGEPEQKVYGVLTDYDLSSWTDPLNPDYTKTSQQRTGTPPYMAHELLKGTSRLHLCRHDVESLFYIMLLMSARYIIGTPEKEEKPRVLMRGSMRLPYQAWFDDRDYVIGILKEALISSLQAIELSPVFEDFRPWLWDPQFRFSEGFGRKGACMRQQRRAGSSAGGVVPFDGETLGGCIDYPSIIEPTRRLAGNLKGSLSTTAPHHLRF
jgi:hypothetical protein